jgi:hypothetical protein
VSSGTTLVAGVGVLLLAIGLGVLIGRLGHNSTSNQKASAPPVQVVTVQGGGGGASTAAAVTTATTATTSAAPKAPKGLSGKLKAAAESTAPPPKAVQQKATQAAGKVLGNSNHLASPTVKVGGSCSNGQAGCSGNHFTGNFFSP